MSCAPEEDPSSLRDAGRARFQTPRGRPASRRVFTLGVVKLGVIVLVVACAGSPSRFPAATAEDFRAELERADRAWSAAASGARAADAIAAMLADDVRLLQDGEPIARGRSAAVAALERSADAGAEQTWTPLRVDVSRDGRFGYSYGLYELRALAADAPAELRPGKYIAVWRRGGDDVWRAVAYVRSPRAPGKATATLPAEFAALVARIDADPAPGAPNARIAAMDADRRFAAMAADSGVGAAFAAFAAADGVLLGGGPTLVMGPDGIRAAFSGRPPGATLVWHPVDALSSDAGDLAFTIGEAESRNPGTGAVGHSKYLTVWRRQHDGRWLYVVDGGNARPAPPASRGPTTGTGGP
jgi:ketosteroid isomerase-like protein